MWFGLPEFLITAWNWLKELWDRACELRQRLFDDNDDDWPDGMGWGV